MNLSCQNCEEILSSYLSDLPLEYRNPLVRVICESMNLDCINDCEEIMSCFHTATLSSFTRNGNDISITYTNENNEDFTSSFNFIDVLSNYLNGVDPKCITDQDSWNEMTYEEKLQSIIDFDCNCCTTTTTTTSTTTTTTLPVKLFTIINSCDAVPFDISLKDSEDQVLVSNDSTLNGEANIISYETIDNFLVLVIDNNGTVSADVVITIDGVIFFSGIIPIGITTIEDIPSGNDIVFIVDCPDPTTTTTSTTTSTTVPTTTTTTSSTSTTTAPPVFPSTTTTTTSCPNVIGIVFNEAETTTTTTTIGPSTTTTTTIAPSTTTTTTGITTTSTTTEPPSTTTTTTEEPTTTTTTTAVPTTTTTTTLAPTTTTSTTAAPTTTTTTTSTTTTSTTTTTTLAPDLVWAAGTRTCEKDGAFSVVKTITGLSTPYFVWYDTVNNLVYVADADDVTGNVYWFDPDTATVAGDMIHSATISSNTLYGPAVDTQYRRIYFVGKDSGGLISYDIDTDIATVVPYGTNGVNFGRLTVTITSDKLYCTDRVAGSIVIIDRATLTILSTKFISTIPNNTRFGIGGYQIFEVGTELWIVAGTGSSVSTIGIYTKDLNTNITNITLAGTATWDLGKYWQTMFFDDVSGNVYASDFGSGKRFVINPVTRTVLNQRSALNRNGKVSVHHHWSKHPITGALLCSIQEMNNTSDGDILKRVYIEDRTSYLYTKMYENQYYDGIISLTGTSKLAAAFPGTPVWSGVPTANTDGSIAILDTVSGSDNTGWEITLTLEEIDQNTMTPTGNTKPNELGDPDYIAPEYNPTDCPLPSNLDCPADLVTTFTNATDLLEYEFSISSGVKNNASILKIRVSALNTTTSLVEGTPVEFNSPFSSYYFSGSFSSLTGTAYTIRIEYLGAADVVLQTC